MRDQGLKEFSQKVFEGFCDEVKNEYLLRSFTCSLTGEKVNIYSVGGTEIALNK